MPKQCRNPPKVVQNKKPRTDQASAGDPAVPAPAVPAPAVLAPALPAPAVLAPAVPAPAVALAPAALAPAVPLAPAALAPEASAPVGQECEVAPGSSADLYLPAININRSNRAPVWYFFKKRYSDGSGGAWCQLVRCPCPQV